MPLYEYECESCGRRFERIQKFSDPPPEACPTCGGPVRKLLSSPAIQFKGSGFYITDYPKKSEASETAKKGADSAESKSDTKESTSKSAESSSSGTSSVEPAKSAEPAKKTTTPTKSD